MKKVAILLSRQPLRPSGITPWVVQSANAVDWVRENGFTLITSLGMSTWELLVACASINDIRQRVYIPVDDLQEFGTFCKTVVKEFDLDSSLTELIPVIPTEPVGRSALMQVRDQTIADEADILIPISIRPGGNMNRLVTKAQQDSRIIVTDYQIPYQGRHEPLSYDINTRQLNPDLDSIGSNYVIHWTRTCNTAWPDERQIDYWQAVLSSRSYPRSAFQTLEHILAVKKITASVRHMPGRIPTVSFSASLPTDVIPLMRWRARYREMSFEPYGIGIEKNFCKSPGIQPVIYFDSSKGEKPDKEIRWRSQSQGEKTDWRQEKEYRHRGDVHLSTIPHDKLCAFCYTSAEALEIRSSFGIRAVSICNNDSILPG